MFSLLTGKPYDHDTNTRMVEEPWTAEDHLAAMRRLLAQASKNQSDMPSADRLIAVAGLHAEAAKTAGRVPLPVKTAPAMTAPAVVDKDTALDPQPRFCEYGDRVRLVNGGNKGTVTDLTRGAVPEHDLIRVLWDDVDNGRTPFECLREQLVILSRHDAATTPPAAFTSRVRINTGLDRDVL